MSDIVERLRAWVYTDSQYATAREAADEIERLRLRLSIIGDYPGEDNPSLEDNDAAVNNPPNQRNGCGESERKSAR
jgi:hypothetical protein